MKLALTGFTLLTLATALLQAQTATGTVEGTVYDPSRAVVSGAAGIREGSRDRRETPGG